MLQRRGRRRRDAVARIAIFLGGIHQQRQQEEGLLYLLILPFINFRVRWAPHFTQSGFSSVDAVRDPSGGGGGGGDGGGHNFIANGCHNGAQIAHAPTSTP